MSLDLALHNFIDRYNVLQTPTQRINAFLRERPALYKTALIVNHIFRALAMTGLAIILPFSLPVNIAICFGSSLFYRLTVETNCAYKFAMPAFFGSLAIPLALTALTSLISGVALASFGAFALAFISLVPLAGYLTYTILTVSYDVDSRLAPRAT